MIHGLLCRQRVPRINRAPGLILELSIKRKFKSQYQTVTSRQRPVLIRKETTNVILPSPMLPFSVINLPTSQAPFLPQSQTIRAGYLAGG